MVARVKDQWVVDSNSSRDSSIARKLDFVLGTKHAMEVNQESIEETRRCAVLQTCQDCVVESSSCCASGLVTSPSLYT